MSGRRATIARAQGDDSKARKVSFMSLHIDKEQTRDVAVLQCAGRIVSTESLCLLRDAVTSLSQSLVIVLDLSEVTMVGARGLGMLVSLHNWACANGIQLKLVNPSKLVREVLAVRGRSVFVVLLPRKDSSLCEQHEHAFERVLLRDPRQNRSPEA